MGLTSKEVGKLSPEAQKIIAEQLKAQGVDPEADQGVVSRAVRAVAGYIRGSAAQAQAAERLRQLYLRCEQLAEDMEAEPSGEAKSAAAVVRAALPVLIDALNKLGDK